MFSRSLLKYKPLIKSLTTHNFTAYPRLYVTRQKIIDNIMFKNLFTTENLTLKGYSSKKNPIPEGATIPDDDIFSLENLFNIHIPENRQLLIYKTSSGISTNITCNSCSIDTIKNKVAIKEYFDKLLLLLDVDRIDQHQWMLQESLCSECDSDFIVTQNTDQGYVVVKLTNKILQVSVNVFSFQKYDPVVISKFTADFFGSKDYHFIVNHH